VLAETGLGVASNVEGDGEGKGDDDNLVLMDIVIMCL
jgi:hypothetical protein